MQNSRQQTQTCGVSHTISQPRKQTKLLQRKGLYTVCLLLIAESVTLTNAVHFWSTYQSWSNTYGRGRFQQYTKNCNQGNQGNQDSSDCSELAQEIPRGKFHSLLTKASVATKASIATTAPKQAQTQSQPQPLECPTGAPTKTKHFHPRKLIRLAKGLSKNTHCSSQMYNCCATACPDCVNFGSSSSEGSLLASTSAHLAAHLFDVRGGHISASTVESAADVVLTAAVTAVTPYNLPLNLWKVIFQFFLTLLNVACWLIPLQSDKISENKFGLSMANAFSGGVFLSLAFGHLIPECVHGFEGYNEALPFMIVLSGYLLIFFVEKVAFSDAHDMFHSHEGASSSPSTSKEVDEGHSKVVGKSAVILLGALAVHSILEMTALGLADTFGDSALLSLSIALHQPAESIALLVAFLKSGMSKDQIIFFLSIFSAMGPIGVAIGMAVNEFAAPIIDSIMLATVAGTFVYVGATEVIPEEWEDAEHKWPKFFALLSGIVSIFGITQYTMTLEGHGQ